MQRTNSQWKLESKTTAQKLHSQLTITNKEWHQLKSNADRRAAELLSGAMIQLLSEGEKTNTIRMIEQSLLWIKREIKDPGCSSH